MPTARHYTVAVVPGDGIGPEVIAEGVKVLNAASDAFDFSVVTNTYDLGADRYRRTGEVLPESVLNELAGYDAILFGAMGRPDVPPGVLERNFILKLRREFDQYVNLRPVKSLASRETAGDVSDVDLVIVRENNEGLYGGSGGVSYRGQQCEVAVQESINTRHGVQRLVEYAFSLSRSRGHRLSLCHKSNVLTFAGDLWTRVVDEVGSAHPEVTHDYVNVDAACLHLVANPQRFDVVCTDSMFGDILSDLAAALVGGLGFAGSGNINPARAYPSMFEPIHGSAPDIAGRGIANPIATVLATSMLLDHVGEPDAARSIEESVAAVRGKFSPSSDRPEATTAEMGDMIASVLG